eukprot:TRINITY_DN931_c1_g1_i2.p3 TRINITY_DN931_c1_g1~~TRINITY_DN931_c1_g1_i2.p3  ORF type:complete len:113 (-),score=9.80 TRINITY_DN931_c1_g1_i2:320-658(-)
MSCFLPMLVYHLSPLPPEEADNFTTNVYYMYTFSQHCFLKFIAFVCSKEAQKEVIITIMSANCIGMQVFFTLNKFTVKADKQQHYGNRMGRVGELLILVYEWSNLLLRMWEK